MDAQTPAPGLRLHSSEGVVTRPVETVRLPAHPGDDVKTTPFERQFNPYEFNGGTTVVLAGEDFAIAAGCTRMSSGYEILSRDQTKLYELYEPVLLL